jgi:hypothetical protein
MMADVARRRISPATWATIAELGRLHWLCGNIYETAVNMPRLLSDAHRNRRPGVLAAGSPVRYYLPVAPVTFIASAVALTHDWRAGGDRRAIIAAAAGTASSAALTGYLVGAVNLRLLRSSGGLGANEADSLIRTWHRGNLIRLTCLAVTALAARRTAGATDVPD